MEFVVAKWNGACSLAKSCLRIGALASNSGTETGSGLVNIPAFLCLDGKGSDKILGWWNLSVDFLQVFKLFSFRISVMPLLDRMPAAMVVRFGPVFISLISSLIGGEV